MRHQTWAPGYRLGQQLHGQPCARSSRNISRQVASTVRVSPRPQSATRDSSPSAGIGRRTTAGMRSRSRWRTSRSVGADGSAIAPARSGGAVVAATCRRSGGSRRRAGPPRPGSGPDFDGARERCGATQAIEAFREPVEPDAVLYVRRERPIGRLFGTEGSARVARARVCMLHRPADHADGACPRNRSEILFSSRAS